MDAASVEKPSDLNPPEKYKIPTKNKHIFLTSEQLLHTYYQNVNAFMG